MPRIALISDVHGNTPALLAVLDAIAHDGVDTIVDLGDIASGGVDPRGTLDALRARPDILTVRGNHERQLLTLSRGNMGASDRLAFDLLSGDDLLWLAALPATLEPAHGVLAFHGAPDDDLCYLLEAVDPAADDALRQATDGEVVERLGASFGHYELFVCGHTHVQRTRRLPGGALVVNPGSVGWPAYADDLPAPHRVQARSPRARYTVVEKDAAGWRIDERAIDYDYDAAIVLALRNGRPDVAHALRTGFVGADAG
ncbi:metallophosphoesterase family protein [Humibacter ginsenosidimutans]|uniref:Metallophosphoesterase family protein n=1 Tax=Humibacter ginsenosidimutans TaxID=2599293 RepID=A0A5B8M7Y2_9MICO|nr:metallophosphoesterase family protein [Humibacter ginsenosidimutans]QDZ16124.1 metallophosphoesterase family protein [Humibacter ginsenosidimutans]